jgi:hypothetical protein
MRSEVDDAVSDLDGVGLKSLGTRCSGDGTGTDVEHALMQRAFHLVRDQVTVRERRAAMRAFVLGRVDAAFDMEQRDRGSFELATPGFTLGQVGKLKRGVEGLGHIRWVN